jgi:hypothetical protein
MMTKIVLGLAFSVLGVFAVACSSSGGTIASSHPDDGVHVLGGGGTLDGPRVTTTYTCTCRDGSVTAAFSQESELENELESATTEVGKEISDFASSTASMKLSRQSEIDLESDANSKCPKACGQSPFPREDGSKHITVEDFSFDATTKTDIATGTFEHEFK